MSRSFGGADLHGHSNRSDGVETPARYAALASEAGLSVCALTDHDALAGLPEFEAASRAAGVVPVAGVELSVGHEGEDVHLVGLFVDPEDAPLSRRLVFFRGERDRRGERMVSRLASLGMPLDLAAIRSEVGDGAFGRPHVARAMLRAGHVASVEEAFGLFLTKGKPAYVPKAKWSLVEAISAVRGAGGLAILAHPGCYRDPEGIVAAALPAGLDGIEVLHPDHDAAASERFRALARSLSLLVSGGSDFHGASEGGTALGLCRLSEAEWKTLAAAARERRRAAGRPAPLGA